MFYVRTQLNDDTAIEVDISEENVYTRCPECGQAIPVDLNSLVDENGVIDLFNIEICCPKCSRAHWAKIQEAIKTRDTGRTGGA